MAAGTGSKVLMGTLLAANLVIYLVILGLAGWSLDKYIDGKQNHPRYQSVAEMIETKSWGNRFAFMHVPIPEVGEIKSSNPLEFVYQAQKVMERKKNSLAIPLIGILLNTVDKLKGPETAAKYIHSTLNTFSAAISNMIGPVEQMALANHPVKGIYFMVAGSPESLTVIIMSYMGNLRIVFGMEKDFIDSQRFKSCMETSLEMILKAASKIPAKF